MLWNIKVHQIVKVIYVINKYLVRSSQGQGLCEELGNRSEEDWCGPYPCGACTMDKYQVSNNI